MLQFKSLKQAENIIETKDDVDVAKDFANVLSHLSALNNNPSYEVIKLSFELDKSLHSKYPIIDKLLDLGSKLSSAKKGESQALSDAEAAKSNLTQDYFGILCDTLIKKEIITSANQFIDHVD